MKKVLFICLFLFFSFVFCFGETPAALKKVITKEMIIPPDPDNPFQGTWYFSATRTTFYVVVIEGMEGTVYYYGNRRWQRQNVFTIEENDGIYTTSAGVLGGLNRISVNKNDLLTIGNVTYDRYND